MQSGRADAVSTSARVPVSPLLTPSTYLLPRKKTQLPHRSEVDEDNRDPPFVRKRKDYVQLSTAQQSTNSSPETRGTTLAQVAAARTAGPLSIDASSVSASPPNSVPVSPSQNVTTPTTSALRASSRAAPSPVTTGQSSPSALASKFTLATSPSAARLLASRSPPSPLSNQSNNSGSPTVFGPSTPSSRTFTSKGSNLLTLSAFRASLDTSTASNLPEVSAPHSFSPLSTSPAPSPTAAQLLRLSGTGAEVTSSATVLTTFSSQAGRDRATEAKTEIENSLQDNSSVEPDEQPRDHQSSREARSVTQNPGSHSDVPRQQPTGTPAPRGPTDVSTSGPVQAAVRATHAKRTATSGTDGGTGGLDATPSMLTHSIRSPLRVRHSYESPATVVVVKQQRGLVPQAR